MKKIILLLRNCLLFAVFTYLAPPCTHGQVLLANTDETVDTTFGITGRGDQGGTFAESHAVGGTFEYHDVWSDYFDMLDWCTIGQPCYIPDLPLTGGQWFNGSSVCLASAGRCTPYADGRITFKTSFITPPSQGQEFVHLQIPIELEGAVSGFYEDGYAGPARWPLFDVSLWGKGTANVYLQDIGTNPGHLLLRSMNFQYSGGARVNAVYVSSISTPGIDPTGIATLNGYLYESEQGPFGTINQLDSNTGAVLRSFLAPSASGFDGRSKPSDLTTSGGHLFMTDVGTPGTGKVYEFDPTGTAIFNSFRVPFRAGALATDQARLFIGDLDGGQILVTTHNGALIRSLATTFNPAALVFDSADNLLWMAESAKPTAVSLITTKGSRITTCAAPWDPTPTQGTEGVGGLVLGDSVLSIAESGLGLELDPGQPSGPGIVSTTAISNLICIPTLPTRIRLDVKPDSFPNTVNINSNGVLPTAILSSAKFDATEVDPASIRFGDTGTEALPANWSINDVNGDGLPDLEADFRTRQTGIACDTTLVSITGKTFNGDGIRGTDSVKVIGCN